MLGNTMNFRHAGGHGHRSRSTGSVPVPVLGAAVVLLLGLLLTGPAGASLVVNGGFEATSQSGWSVYQSVPGWTLRSGAGIEIQNNVAGSPFEGANLVELDSRNNSRIGQLISTLTDFDYLLEFAFSPRPGIGAASNSIEVFWAGGPIATITADGTGLGDTDWSLLSFVLPGQGSPAWLEFAAVGKSDSLGGYLDAVSLTRIPSLNSGLGGPDVGASAVPLPAPAWLLGAGLFGLLVLRRGGARRAAARWAPSRSVFLHQLGLVDQVDMGALEAGPGA